MIAAAEPRLDVEAQRLLHIDTESGALASLRVEGLPGLVRRGDVWVLNDAATLPASLAGRARAREVEIRLVGEKPGGRWRAVLMGEGSWRDDTNRRPPPPRLEVGATIALGQGLAARVTAVDPRSARLLEVEFTPGGDGFWRALYRLGRPIQYSYLRRELRLDEVQTAYAARPWSAELPSAGRPLSHRLLARMRAAGATIVSLTHAASISATGDPALDAALPLPERLDIPEATARAVQRALDEGRRVVAVGTSTTRALEGVARDAGAVVAGERETGLVLGPGTPLQVVDALLTGAHDPASSHYALLGAFAAPALLEAAVARSRAEGFLGHELGDSWLLT